MPRYLLNILANSRSRHAVSKQMIRQFVRETASHEGWTGAPWLVKVGKLLKEAAMIPIGGLGETTGD